MTVFSKDEGESVWAIASGGYADLTLARQSAELVKSRGGAGYVQKTDEQIEVIYAVYNDEQTANSVLEKLGEKGAYVKELFIQGGDFSWSDSDKKSYALDALCYFDLCFDNLFKLANNLGDGSVSIEDAKIKIKVLLAQIDEIKSVFYQNVQSTTEEEITQIKLALVTANAILNNVSIDDNLQKSISSVRYALVQIVLCYQALTSSL